MTCTQELSESLRALGFRMTPQRHAILHVLKASGKHLSPAQVFEQARRNVPGITEATVYRTLEFLAENGMAQPALNGGRHQVYEISGHDHHHLICSACGKSVEVEHHQIQKLYRQLEARSGFQLTSSHLTFFGLCPACHRSCHEHDNARHQDKIR
jgi:Fur family transcriptional regulator, ferric uptake regulator